MFHPFTAFFFAQHDLIGNLTNCVTSLDVLYLYKEKVVVKTGISMAWFFSDFSLNPNLVDAVSFIFFSCKCLDIYVKDSFVIRVDR